MMDYGTLPTVSGDRATATKKENTERIHEEEKCSENGSESSMTLLFHVVPKNRSVSLSTCRTGGILLGLFLLLVPLSLLIVKTKQNQPMPNVELFDYIVVGGGPSGIITATKLARRLKDDNVRVLLLESGTASQSSVLKSVQSMKNGTKTVSGTATGVLWEDDGKSGLDGLRLNKFDIPLMWSGVASSQGRISALGNALRSNHHWGIRRTLLARALGGCGVHNAMVYVRCLPTDTERWNLTGWTYDDMLRHYKSLESYVDSDWEEPSFWGEEGTVRNKPWRGQHGPIRTVPAGPAIDPVAPLFVQSAINTDGFGLSQTKGFNDPSPKNRLGAGFYEFNIRDGIRDSVAEAFLGTRFSDSPTIPDNLEIRTGATVLRVLTNTDSLIAGDGKPRAVGVEYTSEDGLVSQVMLKHAGESNISKSQVILAAGAIMTPQILVNSGIGPNGDIDLPGVGENLQDHPVVAMSFRLTSNMTRKSSSIYTLGDEMEDYLVSVAELMSLRATATNTRSNSTKHMSQLLYARTGTLGTPGFAAGAFLRSPWSDDEAPDLQLTVFPRVVEPHVTRKERQYEVNFQRNNCMLVTVALLRPDARYSIKFAKPEDFDTDLTSSKSENVVSSASDTNERPTRNPIASFRLPSIETPVGSDEYLSDVDVSKLTWGMEQVRRVMRAPPLSLHTEEEVFPGADRNLAKYVRDNHLPNSHWVGSTKMGPDDDRLAVLDESLRVRGVDSLRVVDAGAIPTVPNGNTHSTVCVLADRAVDFMVSERSL